MQGNLLKVLGVVAIIATLVCFILAALAMIGAVSMGNGCFMRYDDSGKGGMDAITDTVTLNATGNYSNISTPNGTSKLIPDPNRYGEWLNTNISVQNQQVLKLQIEGQLSLCLAYIPKDNLQFTEQTRPGKSNLDDNGNQIPIPRVTDVNTQPVSLIIDAKNAEWRNIAELYNNDRIIVSISPNYNGGVADAFKNTVVTADCTQGKTTYSPICGRYSVYSGEYTSDCKWQNDYWKCNYHHYCDKSFMGGCALGCPCTLGKICCGEDICDSCGAWINITSSMPDPYKDDGTFTVPWSDDLSKLFTDFLNLECANNSRIPPNGQCPDIVTDRNPKNLDFIKGKCNGLGGWIAGTCQGTVEESQLSKLKYFWYTADGNGGKGSTGLIWQMNSSGTVDKNIGTTQFATFVDPSDQPAEYGDIYKVIYKTPFFNTKVSKSYLQYRLWSPPSQDASKNTGGYVLNIKQTKCYRENGNSFTDVFTDRGKVQYITVASAENPNSSGKSYSPSGIDVKKGKATITVGGEGYLWVRILNDQQDYKNSEGSYQVKFSTSQQVGSFTIKVMTPLLTLFKTKVQSAAESIFQNMVCYNRSDSSSCTNFFNYIKAMLILYVMVYGAMYLLGFVKINQQELVIRIIKIGIVSGLMNSNTFEFFNNYLFNAITGFSDEIISNMSGYSLFTSTNTISNPFMFLDAVMSKIFFSQTFIAQLLALLSLGLSGIIYFIIVFVAIMIVIITALRAVAVYIMAFMATCILIGIAPLFLTFMLFDFTRYLFDNWVRFTLRYMLEPVILMAGIIVLTQLFTIYLDFVLGYSVCWKCALAIKIPFVGIAGLDNNLLNVPIFCINWFAPWGMDYNSGMMGVNMQHIIALVIIAYGMYGYVEFSGEMVAKLTSATGPSATKIGGAMSDTAETGALKQIGMDKESRAKIKQGAKQRLKTRNSTLDEAQKNRNTTPESKKPEDSGEEKSDK
ncbi:type IV secretion system protein [Rickettsia endosymbiont of Ceutorhynchus obstrictus]|uniref:type IV secretion system protein n=1 Tax=Rickettsia endosymbiont of Ceutorhynchus obstrictus TaxID=3066249 RepID=UPI00313305D3